MAETLSEVTQEQFDVAEAAVIGLIRAEYPNLDLRKGTVLRDILIRPAAAVYALNADRMEDLQIQSSLTRILENEDTIDPSAVDAVLANFGVTRNTGATATGQVMIKVSQNRQYNLVEGAQFVSLEGLTFLLTEDTIVSPDPVTGEVRLLEAEDGSFYYFIVDMVAAAPGAEYNVSAGVALEPVTTFVGYLATETYTAFSGGEEDESISEVITRLPAAISYRALESRTSIEAKLRDNFADADFLMHALSVQGYGDRTQLRDKHNPMGIAVGSRVDLYPRTFLAPRVVTLQKTATRISANTYQFVINVADAPAFYAIRSISEVESVIAPDQTFGSLPVAGSYAFSEVRGASGLGETFHDVDPDNTVESAFTVFQTSTVTVTGVPATTETHPLKVEVYAGDGIADIQTYVDSFSVRNVEADYLVRSPLICFVSLNVIVYYPQNARPDESALQQSVVDYINGRSFVERLTRSELACILRDGGASRLDFQGGMTLQGIILDAGNVLHTLQGDSLNLESIADPDVLLAPETAVFATETANIYIEMVAE
jgi:hypothetical protein